MAPQAHAIIARTVAPLSTEPAARRPTSAWIARGLLFVAVVFLLKEARPVLLPVVLAIVFTFVLAAPVRALHRAGLHPYVGAGLVLTAALALIALVFALVAAPAAAWWSRAPLIAHDLLEALQRWRDALFPYSTPAPLSRPPLEGAVAPDAFHERMALEGWTFTRLAIGETLQFALSASATVILLYFLLATEQWLVARSIVALRTRRTRALVLAAFRHAQVDIGLFITTMSLVNVALGVATGIALWLIGLPNPVLWGTTTAVLAFVPYLGPLLIAILLLLAGSVSFGTGIEMVGPPAAFLALHCVEANFLTPMIMGHRLRISPVFVFLSVIVWGWLWGIAGAFLAVPLLLGLRAASRHARSLKLVHAYLTGHEDVPLQDLLHAPFTRWRQQGRREP